MKMTATIVSVLLGVICYFIAGNALFQCVKVSNRQHLSLNTNHQQSIYLIHNNQTAWRLAGNQTAKILNCYTSGFIYQTFQSMSHRNIKIIDEPIFLDNLFHNSKTTVAKMLTLSKTIYPTILSKVVFVGKYANGAVFPFQDRLFMLTSFVYQPKPRYIESHERFQYQTLEKGLLYGRWIGYRENTTYFGFNNTLQLINNKRIIGYDPRIVIDSRNNRLYIAYCLVEPMPERMAYMEFYISQEDKKLRLIRGAKNISYGDNHTIRHKNWVPFLYKHELYFIVYINPLTVVKIIDQGKLQQGRKRVSNRAKTQIISLAEEIPSLWFSLRAELRGGTNAVYIPQIDQYLAFFHAVIKVKKVSNSTYYMGCYTFSSRPPFKLKLISPAPIMTEPFYTGPKHRFGGMRIDYVLFPMQLSLINDTKLLLSAGHNDIATYLFFLDLHEVIDSMMDISSPRGLHGGQL